MLLLALYPVLLILLGALLYAFSGNPKLSEIGRGLFWAGAFAFAFSLAHQTVRIGAP